MLGFEPVCLFDGPVDIAIGEDLAVELLATLREALSNVARHADATSVRVEVIVSDRLSLRVTDDGIRPSVIGHAHGASGSRTWPTRASRRGGEFALTARSTQRSAAAVWTVPLS